MKNPGRKRHSAKFDRCVKKVQKRRGKKPRNAYAVCTKTVKNPGWYIHVQRDRGPVMMWNGRSFNNQKGEKPVPFHSAESAMSKARYLLGKFHRALSSYKIWVSDQLFGSVQEKRRVNPESLDEAARKLEDFSGHPATREIRAKVSDDKTGLVIGELDRIGYQTRRKGVEGGRLTHYSHKFSKNSRPLLTVTSDGNQLRIVGGRYEFTEAGIEDR